MELPNIDISEIADLPTQIANCGAISVGGVGTEAMFEHIIGIAVLVHRQHP